LSDRIVLAVVLIARPLDRANPRFREIRPKMARPRQDQQRLDLRAGGWLRAAA